MAIPASSTSCLPAPSLPRRRYPQPGLKVRIYGPEIDSISLFLRATFGAQDRDVPVYEMRQPGATVIVLAGPGGCGKTHTAELLRRHLMQIGHQVEITEGDELLPRYRRQPYTDTFQIPSVSIVCEQA